MTAGELNRVEIICRLINRHRSYFRDGLVIETDVERNQIESLTVTVRANDQFFGHGFGRQFTGVLVDSKRILEGLEAVAHAGRAPAVLGVVGEQARVKFREALLAVRAVGGRREGAFFALLFDIQNSFAEVQRDSDELFDLSFVLRRDLHRAGRQINVVFCETRQGREAECRDFFPVHNQVLIAFVSCPNRQVLVEAFTVFDQGCEEGNFLTLISLHDRGKNLILRLLDDRHIAGRAVLGAELHIEQTQEMINLRHCGDGGFLASSRGALFNRNRRRNTVNRVNVRRACGLHHGSSKGVERFQISALTFVEDQIKGQGGFTGTRDACDDGELVARDMERQVLQIVLTRIDDRDGIFGVGQGLRFFLRLEVREVSARIFLFEGLVISS